MYPVKLQQTQLHVDSSKKMACCVIADYVPSLVRRPVLGHNKCTFSRKFEILENDTNTKCMKLLNFNYSFVITAMQR
jgi:hypothetical protein